MIDSILKIKEYNCFGEDFEGYDSIYPLNIIIGRNNSGKSSLLDIIELFLNKDPNIKGDYKFLYSKKLTEEDIGTVFIPGTTGGGLSGDHWQFGQNYLGTILTMEVYKKSRQLIDISLKLGNPHVDSYITEMAKKCTISLKEYKVKRLRAERHIVPEEDMERVVQEDGAGATTIIQRYITKSDLPSELVEKQFLNELNKIFEPDLKFIDIVVQQSGILWEIYLEEEGKGRIALSKSGSGIQTVILILIYIHLIPHSENKLLSNYLFLFEELENNLHPALLRRLFLYIKDVALKNKAYFFITTHSNVVIDLFNNDNSAQILHVIHDGKYSKVKKVKAYAEIKGVLDDLDIRASDLLQSNGIIWVEGPSDRIYLNKWIELYSNGELKENAHYQIVFYGGRLLSHLSADSNIDPDLINILKVNNNCIFLMDSDKKRKNESLNDTKSRIKNELNNINGYVWVTKGREIENYIPEEILSAYLGKDKLPTFEQYEALNEYLDNVKKKEGNKYLSNKVLFAEKIRTYMNETNYYLKYDLKDQLRGVINFIKKWNGIN